MVLSGPWGTSMIPELDHYELGGPQGDCMEWTKTHNSSGYGYVWYKNKMHRVHRLAYQLNHPDEDITGKVIRHVCDNPTCMNPEHLLSGTHQDNMDDRKVRKRTACGIKNGNGILTEIEVDRIRELKGRLSQRKIASLFGITQATVYKIFKGLSHGISDSQ